MHPTLRVALDEYNYDRMVDPLVVARARTRVLVLRAAYTEAIAKVEAGGRKNSATLNCLFLMVNTITETRL